jgi:hypothetical protein
MIKKSLKSKRSKSHTWAPLKCDLLKSHHQLEQKLLAHSSDKLKEGDLFNQYTV